MYLISVHVTSTYFFTWSFSNCFDICQYLSHIGCHSILVIRMNFGLESQFSEPNCSSQHFDAVAKWLHPLLACLHLNKLFSLSMFDDWIHILVIHRTQNIRLNVTSSFYSTSNVYRISTVCVIWKSKTRQMDAIGVKSTRSTVHGIEPWTFRIFTSSLLMKPTAT